MNNADDHTSATTNWNRSCTDMHRYDNNFSQYKFQIPFAPARSIVIAESQRTVLAPTYSLAPGATPGGWTQTIRLAHDFLLEQHGVTGEAVWR